MTGDRDAEEVNRAAGHLPGVLPVTCNISKPREAESAVAETEATFVRLDNLMNMERMIEAELTAHLRYEDGKAAPAGQLRNMVEADDHGSARRSSWDPM